VARPHIAVVSYASPRLRIRHPSSRFLRLTSPPAGLSVRGRINFAAESQDRSTGPVVLSSGLKRYAHYFQ